ncbi:MAG: methionine--tRNA ligase, partial [Deltaproteobacteria bacterium]|nr:methionine--tRNA ligase [Deltaproteobacteria bacterium]
MKKFYLTTAIDYVNNLPHVGTAYEKIGADVLARFTRLQGFQVYFQIGSDEHSANVFKAAQKAGLDPKTYCNRMRKTYEEIWKKLNISYDGFVQTIDPQHAKGVQKLFQTIYDNGDIDKKPYEGWYCESCEAFYTEKDLANGLCPNHQSKPKWLEEENYFFQLSKYQDRLLEHIHNHPEFILPAVRRNEILRVIEGGLKDISVSRSTVTWGIPVPFDKKHVVYVWFDALINYMTGVGFGGRPAAFKKWWPADCHIIGKDITRFHCVIWPAMLMSAGLPLPKCVFGHGFVYLKGEKMSKTLGNVITPMDIADVYGADALRYYLLRTSSFGADGDFTWEDFIRRYNGDLANGLGNLVSRTATMVEQFVGVGVVRGGTTDYGLRTTDLSP